VSRSRQRATSSHRGPWRAAGSAPSAGRKDDAGALREAAAALLATGDPLAIGSNQSLHMVKARDPAARSTGLYFDGVLYCAEDGDPCMSIRAALDLAVCSDGLPCELDRTMLLACLGRRLCTADRVAFMHGFHVQRGGMNEEQFKELLAMAARLRERLAARDVAAFGR